MSRRKKTKRGAKEMLNKEVFQKGALCSINLTEIESDGSFTCPKCGTTISPEDETEEIYTILDTKVVNDELVELVISCGTCGTHIRLTGFAQTMEGLANA
jgi:predicted RNA-binding Zn-ribbon protein involved in translation (DUF1610 family)